MNKLERSKKTDEIQKLVLSDYYIDGLTLEEIHIKRNIGKYLIRWLIEKRPCK